MFSQQCTHTLAITVHRQSVRMFQPAPYAYTKKCDIHWIAIARVLKWKLRNVCGRHSSCALVGHLSRGCIKCAPRGFAFRGETKRAGRKPLVELREKRWQAALLNVIAAVDAPRERNNGAFVLACVQTRARAAKLSILIITRTGGRPEFQLTRLRI